jgi:hypothetical protein
MKKLNCLLILALVCTGLVFTQEQTDTESVTRKNAITLDLLTLFKGFIASDSNTDTIFGCMAFGYERLISPHFSVGAEVDLYPGTLNNKSFMFFGFAAAARYYPMSSDMDKFFFGALLGFNLLSTEGKIEVDNGDFTGMFAGLRAGYKLHLTNMFFIEPSMSYTYSKTNFEYMGLIPHNFGWQASLRAGISF